MAVCGRDGTPLTSDAVGDEPGGASTVFAEGTVLGAYRLLHLLGEGGMGRVYVAEHAKLGRKVALKLLRREFSSNPGAIKRFFREARAVNQINHENIIEITDFIEEPGRDNYYIMEHLDGESIDRCLSREKVLSPPRAAAIALQMAEALSAAHEKGIVHRDLKPENVFLIERGGKKDFVKILDFGIAKLMEVPDGESLHKTSAGSILGTPEYMSPEQASGKPVDHRSDIYSLGIIIYEMATGRKPFSGRNFGEVLIKHLSIMPPAPGRLRGLPYVVPKPLEALVMQCLEKEADKRPQNMREVADRLRPVAQADAAGMVATPSMLPEIGPRRAWLIGAAAAVVVAAAGAGLLLFTRGDAPAPAPVVSAVAHAPADTGTPEAAVVAVSFSSEPQGAAVFRQGGTAPLGTTPFKATLPRSEVPVSFEFRAEGFRTAGREAVLVADVTISAPLEKAPAAPVPDKQKRPVKAKKPDDRPAGDLDKRGVIDPFAE